jgi:DNA-binding NtrC family response regulator
MSALASSVLADDPESAPAASARFKVALLTDRVGVCRFLQKELSRHGLEVLVARNANELRACLGRSELDAVLVDLSQEEGSSLALLRQLAEQFPAVQRAAIADQCSRLLRRVAARFGRTDLLLERAHDRSAVEQLLRHLLDRRPGGPLVQPGSGPLLHLTGCARRS